MPIQADSIAFDALTTDPAAPDDGQQWQNALLGEPRTQRQGVAETLLTAPSHLPLDQLAHVIAESGVTEETRNADGALTSRTIRTAASPAGVAIRTWDNFTFDAEGLLDGYRVRQFNALGAAVQTLTVSRPLGVWTSVLS